MKLKLSNLGLKCFQEIKPPESAYTNHKGKVCEHMTPLKSYCIICNKALGSNKKYHKDRHINGKSHIRNSVLFYQNQNKKKDVSNNTLLKQIHRNNKLVRE